uniref:Reverse transcriptase domain-containing protein n=1 Tax=Tanacetum cinerariifolium TaxID=118510 RepID=A0A699KGS8_TANCI|nr:reverse transcriptase domain-containing protein [Tanacetum cinerariifolium]
MADNRPMTQMLQAPIEGYEDAIVEDLVSKFINQFFPPSNATYLRNEITNFLQKPNETFNEAWEHFKDLLRQCPHHGFSELHQLDTFYNALNPNDQDALDSATGGNLLDKIPRECLSIIKSFEFSLCNRVLLWWCLIIKILLWTVLIDSSLVLLTVLILIEIVALETILVVVLMSRLIKSWWTHLVTHTSSTTLRGAAGVMKEFFISLRDFLNRFMRMSSLSSRDAAIC